MGKQAPEAPDYEAAARAQGEASTRNIAAQTQANRPNVSTAFGSQRWTQGPDGQWSMQAGLSPQMQGLFNDVKAFDFGSLGEMGNGDAARDQAINAAYNQATSRLNPQWEQRENQARAQLANQGLDPNSQAYRNAMNQLSQQRNDAYSSAMNSAIGMGQQAGDAVFRNNMMSRQQAIAEALRSPQLSALQGMMGFMQTPGFHGAGAADAGQFLNAAGMRGNYNMQKWKGENEANADLFGGIMDVAGTVGTAIASDERVKRDIERLPIEALPGVPFARFRYLPEIEPTGRRFVGVIAQDLEKVAPKYVQERHGVKFVDYSFLREA